MKVYSQLERASVENLASDPSPGVVGRIFYNTTEGLYKVDTGSALIAVSSNIEVLASDPSAGRTGRIFYNSTAGILKFDTGSAIKAISGQVEKLSSDPAPSIQGRLFYNTSTNEFKGDTGSSIVTFGEPAVASTDESDVLRNLAVLAGVAANQLTVTIKTKSGAEPSAGSPVTVGFRSSTAGTGLFNTRSLTAALNVVVPSGTTIGTRNRIEETIYVYLIDNAGTVEVAVSLTKYDETSLISTTAVSGGADRFAVYSTTARANVPIRLVGRLLSTQVTAGTWAAALTEQSTKHTDNVHFEESSRAYQNYLHNGGHEIWQRSTSISGVSATRVVADRWKFYASGGGACTIQRSTDVPLIGNSLFKSIYSQHADVVTADGSIGVSDIYAISQTIEGFDFANLRNQPCSLSFWVKATKVGVNCIGFSNGTNDRSYVAEYTVNSTGTWEYKEIPINFNYSGGTENYDNQAGMQVYWTLAAGSLYQTTADSWQNGYFVATASQVNNLDSTSNDFRIAMCQLNVGTRAIPFRRCGRTFQEELGICRRYYEKSYDLGDGIGAISSNGRFINVYFSDNRLFVNIPYKVQKRVAPAAGTAFQVYNPLTGSSASIRRYNSPDNITVDYTGIFSGEWQASGYLERTGGSSFIANIGYVFHYAADADF